MLTESLPTTLIESLAVELLLFCEQCIVTFTVIRIGNNGIDRTNLNTLRLIKKTNTPGAPVRINHINQIALRNGIIRAFTYTYTA
jgi:hypothetical protein